MSNLQVACCLILAMSGCALEGATPDKMDAVQPEKVTRLPTFQLDPILIISRDSGRKDWGRDGWMLGPSGAIQPIPDDASEVPTGLQFSTCETEPQEVAAPLNAADGKYCDVLQVVAYRQDDDGLAEVSTDFIWTIESSDIARLEVSSQPTYPLRRVIASYDTFNAADALEPATEVTVCAVPRAGMTDFPPLCRSLPVKAVVNLEGAWCFSGATLDSDCTDITIRQDGRYLYFGDWGAWNGRVLNRKVEFSRNGFVYRGYLDATNAMHGSVYAAGAEDEPLGEWSAWQLPLF